MEPAAAQQQAIERINQASNILVTVSSNPSVDQLAACIGLTLLLNRMGKHATAVFSGQVPSTIEFLKPEQTIEKNPDSLRDFIISLDKEKADKLRYKVEDQFVRIFITPYKTSLSEKDLVFAQGDFNVEAVVALGVHNRNELDAVITAHGRILHDATVISVVAGKSQPANLGQINWLDPNASSLSEMMAAMAQALGTDLIDNQMATAFLTGIVAETKRFSNDKTTPRSMNVAAQLMSAGANQQLIVSKLEPPQPPDTAGSTAKKSPEPQPPDPGVLSISHNPEVADTDEVEVDQENIKIDEKGNIADKTQAAPEPAETLEAVEPQPPAEVPQVEEVAASEPAETLETQQPIEEPEEAPEPLQAAEEPVEAVEEPQEAEVVEQPEALEEQVPEPMPSPPPAATPPVEVPVPQPPVQAPPVTPPAPAAPQLAELPAEEPEKPPQIILSNARPLPNVSASQSSAKPVDNSAIPGPHSVLDPSQHQPDNNSPFTADTKPAWNAAASSDPLLESSGSSNIEDTSFTAQAKPVAPPVDNARQAVNSALAAVPFDPGGHPVASLNAQSIDAELHQPRTQAATKTPPPTLPPPLMTSPGVVIPNPPPQVAPQEAPKV